MSALSQVPAPTDWRPLAGAGTGDGCCSRAPAAPRRTGPPLLCAPCPKNNVHLRRETLIVLLNSFSFTGFL